MGNFAKTKRERSPAYTGRDGGGFCALPWSVLDSAVNHRLSFSARALLLDIARQIDTRGGVSNGKLLCSWPHMEKRGWKSPVTLDKAKDELLAAGFIHETHKGGLRNGASWFAVTWYNLHPADGFDAGAVESFPRGAYNCPGMREKKTKRPKIPHSGNVGDTESVSTRYRNCTEKGCFGPFAEYRICTPLRFFHL